MLSGDAASRVIAKFPDQVLEVALEADNATKRFTGWVSNVDPVTNPENHENNRMRLIHLLRLHPVNEKASADEVPSDAWVGSPQARARLAQLGSDDAVVLQAGADADPLRLSFRFCLI